jgi:hypothetical protein
MKTVYSISIIALMIIVFISGCIGPGVEEEKVEKLPWKKVKPGVEEKVEKLPWKKTKPEVEEKVEKLPWKKTKPEVEEEKIEKLPGKKVKIVLAGNFHSEGGANRDEKSGADLYLAEYDLNKHEVLSVERLTSTPNPEWFPSISQDAAFVVYEEIEDDERKLMLMELGSRKRYHMKDNARFPDISDDGQYIVYSTKSPKDIYMGRIKKVQKGLHTTWVIDDERKITDDGASSDPQLFPDRAKIIFQYKPRGLAASPRIIDLTIREVTDLLPGSGYGHCAVNYDGNQVLFGHSSSSKTKSSIYEDGRWSEPFLLYEEFEVEDLVKYDPRYKDCDGVVFSYAEWCGDNNHIIFSAQGFKEENGKKTIKLSRLFMMDLINEELIDFHSMIEDYYGLSGKESVTASCTPARPAPPEVPKKPVKPIKPEVPKEEPTIPPERAKPLYVFYAIHTHSVGDEMKDRETFEYASQTVWAIADTLKKHGAKGTFEVVYGFAEGAYQYQGKDNILLKLEKEGHEVGLHSHKIPTNQRVYESVTKAGITPSTASGFLAMAKKDPQESLSSVLEEFAEMGITVGTSNLNPEDDVRNPFGKLCENIIGEDNDMWEITGNLMYPWRPDYINKNICKHNPNAKILFLDHVNPDWMNPPVDVLGPDEFDNLKPMLDAAVEIASKNPQKVSVWGFVTHYMEYVRGSEGPPEQSAIDALDDFLSYVDKYVAQGKVKYATAREIADIYESYERERLEAHEPSPPLYLFFSIHNEEDWDGKKPTGEPDYNDNEAILLHYTNAMRELGKMLQKHGMKMNFGSDWTFIEGVQKYDPTFFQDLAEMGHEIDAHAHETHVPYLDVKNMLRECGVEPTSVASGGLEENVEKHFEYFDSVYPEFTIIFGLGVKYHHTGGEEMAGWVWRPSMENWLVHDPDGKYIYISRGLKEPGGHANVSTVKRALENLYPDRLNVMRIGATVRQFKADPGTKGIPKEWTAPRGSGSNWRDVLENLDASLTELDKYKDEGRIVYASLTEIARIFEEMESELNFDWDPDTIPRTEPRPVRRRG